MSPVTRPEVAALKPYIPGKPISEVQRELGLTSVIKLASNENPLGPSPLAVAAAQATVAQAHLYPEASSHDLRAALAHRWDLPADWFMVGNGSDEVFVLLAKSYVRSGDRVVVGAPTFSVYQSVSELMGARVREVPCTPGGAMDLEAMAAACTGAAGDAPARMVFLCRPNNPTGGVFPAADLEQFLARIPAETIVVLDEAYHEYDDTPIDTLDFLHRHPNLVATRTFSKVYGLAGLRVGYGVARPDIWAPLWTVREPFSVNSVAQAAALAALDDTAHVAASQALNREGKAYLYALFADLGLKAYQSNGNFILVDLGRDAGPAYNGLLRRGVIVRPGAVFNLPTCLRVTVGAEAENRRFAAALRAVL